MAIQVMAIMEQGGEEIACGERDCITAFEAVMQELREKPAETTGAWIISAKDEWTFAMAGKTEGGYNVQVEDDRHAIWFEVRA